MLSLVTKNSIGVGTGHGDAFGLALDGEDRWSRGKQIAGNGRGTCRGGRGDSSLGLFRCAPGFNRNGLRRGGGLFRTGSCGRLRKSRSSGPRAGVAGPAVVCVFYLIEAR